MISFAPMRASLLASACIPSIALALGAAPVFAQGGADVGSGAGASAPLAGTEAQSAPDTPPDDATVSQAREQEDMPTDFGTDSGGGPGTNGTGIEENQIVVRGARLRGQLDVEQAPLLELGEEDIAAEGVASIGDLVAQIQNQTGSARGRGGGRPVLLINGIRPGSFREFFQYPPEALAKVEVFPEEVAQRFGFPPDRRVINLILKENYQSREIEIEIEGPARGGFHQREVELGYLKIADGGRINANFTAQDASLLTERERGIDQTLGSTSDLASDPDQAEFRSLRADSRSFDAGLSWAKAYLDSGLSLSANANYDRRDSRSLDGLNLVTLSDADGNSLARTFGENDPLERRNASDTLSLAGSGSKQVNAFRVTSTFDGSFTESTTEIDNRFDASAFQEAALAGTLALDGELPDTAEAGFETAFSRSISAEMRNTARGPLVNLPGGELLTTFDLNANWQQLESQDTRSASDVSLTRRVLSTGANFVIPITSRRNGFADALGSFTLNARIGVADVSDFGTLGDYNASLNWAPTDGLDLSATYIYREVAPGLGALGNPQITNLNVPVFDFVTGETVLADVTSGGNPDLPAEAQRDWKFAVNWQLPFIDGTRFTIEYIRNRSDNVTSGFPQITQAIEAAFPDRITRDASGRLVAVDRRSVTFDETRSDRLQFRLSTRGGFGGSQERGGRGGGGRGGPPSSGAQSGSDTNGGNPAKQEKTAQTGERTGQASQNGGRRGAFMALRERICADDGLDLLRRIVTAAKNGEDVSALVPGLPPQMVKRMVARIAGGASEGDLTDDQLEAARSRICSIDPAMMRGRANGADGGGGADGTDRPDRPDRAGRGPQGGPPTPDTAQAQAIQARLCGENGLAEMRKLVARIEAGEDVSDALPGMDPRFLKFGLDRMRGEDGKISDEALDRIRTRICDRAGAAGESAGGNQGQGNQSRGNQSGGGSGRASGGPAFNPFGGGGERRGWRYFANLTHTIELQNEILIAPGVPVLDQLDGDATGAFGFPRHSSRLEAGLFGQGLGIRLSGQYTGETRLDGSDLAGSSDLFFGDLVTFDVRLFSNLNELFNSQSPVLKNLRVSLRMDNVFDGQRSVRDENGNTPINYQPFVIDPVGRFIGVDIRKLF